MATSTTTPRAGLPQWKAEDKVKFITDVSKAFADVDKSFALSGDAFIPCTATYDSATKRHTLTPTQTNITLPEVFTVRFIATASFTEEDKIYIGGKEYTPAYTDGAQAVQTGAWVLNAAVGITCVKTVAKAFVGAGSISQFAKIDEEIASLKDTKANGNTETGDAVNAEKVEDAGVGTVAKLLPSGTDIVEFAKRQKTGHYRGNGIINTPINGWAYFDIVCFNDKYAKIIATAVEDNKLIYLGTIENNAFTKWLPIGTQSEKLNPLNGWKHTHTNFYNCMVTIVGGGIGVINGSIKGGVNVEGTELFNLPSFAIPQNNKYLNDCGGTLSIDRDGKVIINNPFTENIIPLNISYSLK